MTEEYIPYLTGYGPYCIHDIPAYMICGKCIELRRLENREDKFMKILERVSEVLERVDAKL